MNVSLTKDLEDMVREKVRSGKYSSSSEVIREALRQFKKREQLRQARLEDLREAVNLGLEQAERGEVAPLDMAAIKAKARARMEGKP